MQALRSGGYVKASGGMVGGLSTEMKLRTTSRWKPWAERRLMVAFKVLVAAGTVVVGGKKLGFSLFISSW